jgi:4-hydroxy-3-methylbut-2-enyl diphosphate reductase
MKVIRAEVMGMCFGVRDALEAIAEVDSPSTVTIHGQLVHNEEVLSRLRASGFAMTSESDRSGLPGTASVLITAHGISDRERSRLEGAGKRLIDTTCPLVRRVHTAALRLQEEGYFVLVLGRRGHVEVRGIVEDLRRYEVVETVEEVRCYNEPRLGLVCQTTTTAHLAEQVATAVEARNPGAVFHFVDTICLPTKEHQRSLARLLDQVEAVVVIGGRNSNNTRELVSLCRARGKPALHVQSAGELDIDWLSSFLAIGLTAGTSTLESTIDEVYAALLRLPGAVGVS